jgi:hypothetical protein
MTKNQLLYRLILLVFLSVIIFNACSKSSSNTTPVNPCTGVTITITGNAAASDAGSSDGSITASAGGSTGFMFSLNNGVFQTSGTFNNLAAGKYSIKVKNSNGCSDSLSLSVVSKSPACAGQTPGPDFTAVKTIVLTNCAVMGCHNGTQAPDYTVDCTIVDYALLIKQRAVDDANTADQMPQPPRAALSQSDRDKITAWINAGALITD